MDVSWTDVGTFLEDKINNFWLHKIANADVALEERRQGLLAWSGVRIVILSFGTAIAHLHGYRSPGLYFYATTHYLFGTQIFFLKSLVTQASAGMLPKPSEELQALMRF